MRKGDKSGCTGMFRAIVSAFRGLSMTRPMHSCQFCANLRIRLRADVPLGVFLSGGIDSSLVTALAVQEDPTLRAFSVRFDDVDADESGHAARVAHHLGARHYVIEALSASTDSLTALVRQFGEPFADSSAVPTSVLAKYARQHVTVALGGDGGDEGFAGYGWYRTFHRVRQLGALIPPGFPSAISDAIAPSGPRSTFARHRGRISRGLRALERRPHGMRLCSASPRFGPDEVRRPLRPERCWNASWRDDRSSRNDRAFRTRARHRAPAYAMG